MFRNSGGGHWCVSVSPNAKIKEKSMHICKLNRREWIKASGLFAGAFATTRAAVTRAVERAPAAASAASGRSVEFRRILPVKHDVDVFVAGGGPAGVAAALAARDQGARVYLAEAHTCFGGMGTAGRVPVFMQMGDGVNDLAAGIGRRIVDRLKRESRLKGATDIEALKRVYDAEMTEADAAFSFYTALSDAVAEGGHVQYAVCSAPGGMFAVKASVYVDATGDGDLAAWAGAAFEKGDEKGEMMPGSLCSLWSGIDWQAWREQRPPRPHQPQGYMLEKAFEDGVFSVPDRHMTGIHSLSDGMGGGNIGHVFGVDGTDEDSLTKALVTGRKSMAEFERYYRDYLKRGFEQARMVATGERLGIRETRRITGDYVMTLEDYMNRAVFADEIGRYAYPIDIHPSKTDKASYEQHRQEFDRLFKYAKGESYGIPYRILTPRGFDNLLVAGRCVSVDQKVHASLRVMPGCFITGQAAGIAAAMAADTGCSVHDIPIKELQKKLKAFGAYLPNAG
jgi:hypothetical protein